MYHCFKEVKRLWNHLRQYHKLVGAEVNRYANLAVKTIDSLIFDKQNEAHDSTEEEEEENLYEKHFSNDKEVQKTDFYYDSNSSDCGWLANQYHKRQVEYRKLISLDDLNENFDDEESDIDDVRKSDFDEVDVEDEYPDKFFVSSFNEDALMDDFVIWLQTIDSGKNSLCQSKKHKGVLMGIVRWNPDKSISYKNLDDRNFLNGWMSKLLCDGKRAGTIKTYLGSISQFLRFCTIKENNIVTSERVNRMKEIIKTWNSNLFKSIQLRKYDKQLCDLKRFPTPAEIKSLDKSEEARLAGEALHEYVKDNWEISKISFCLNGDYSLTFIVFDNASRPSPVANMTLGELNAAVSQQDGVVVVSVKLHKTGHISPAHVSLTDGLHKETFQYVKYVRSKLVGVGSEDNDSVFISWGDLRL